MSDSLPKRMSQLRPLHLPVFVGAEYGEDKTYLPERDIRGYTILRGESQWDVTPNAISQDDTHDVGRKRSNRITYIEGLRGLVGLQTLLWIFFRIFAPAVVTDRDIDGTFPADFTKTCPNWQNILRKVFSPLMWNGSLQATMFIIIMGRVGMHTFFERRNGLSLAGPGFRRPFRLLMPLAMALALTSVLAVTGSFKHASAMADALNNDLAHPPKVWASTVEYINTLVAYFFTPYAYTTSVASSYIPPSGIMWFTSVVFQQTYVIMVYAWLMPFTVFRWKNIGLISLTLLSAWMGRWSWYTLTGLGIAEYSIVYRQILPEHGIPLNSEKTKFLNAKLIPVIFVFLGVLFKYLWISILPADYYSEVVGHINLNTGMLNHNFDVNNIAYPRWDDWFLCTGLLVLVELSPRLQRFFSSRFLTYLGRLSFSIALVAGTVMLSLGSLLYSHLTVSLGWTNPAQILAVLFFAMVPTSIICADIWSRFVDDGSLLFAKAVFDFFRT